MTKQNKKVQQNNDVENVEQLHAQVQQLTEQLQKAQETERRAMADYQNLMRRTQDDRIRMVKLAGQSIIESLLQPLEHLMMAKEQLKDSGLDMVCQQFQSALKQEGLEEIEVLGQDLDAEIMEVIDKEVVDNPSQFNKVIKVVQRGYTLNGQVIRHPKVIIGIQK